MSVARADWLLGGLRDHLRCAVCQKPVDEVEKALSMSTCEIIYVARCHGATEKVVLTEEALEAIHWRDASVTFAESFADQRALPPTQKMLT